MEIKKNFVERSYKCPARTTVYLATDVWNNMAGGSNYSTGAIGSSLATPDYVIVIVYLVGILAVGLWVGKFCCSVKKIALFLKFYP